MFIDNQERIEYLKIFLEQNRKTIKDNNITAQDLFSDIEEAVRAFSKFSRNSDVKKDYKPLSSIGLEYDSLKTLYVLHNRLSLKNSLPDDADLSEVLNPKNKELENDKVMELEDARKSKKIIGKSDLQKLKDESVTKLLKRYCFRTETNSMPLKKDELRERFGEIHKLDSAPRSRL